MLLRGQGLLGSPVPSLLSHMVPTVNNPVSLYSHELLPNPIFLVSCGLAGAGSCLGHLTSDQLLAAGNGLSWAPAAPACVPAGEPDSLAHPLSSSSEVLSTSGWPEGVLRAASLYVLDLVWTRTPPLASWSPEKTTGVGCLPQDFSLSSTTGNKECAGQRWPQAWPHGSGPRPAAALCWDPGPS